MKKLVDFLKESLNTQHINEGASVESIIMFLNRWNGKCVKICDFPFGTDVEQFTQDLIDEYGEDEYTTIEYCEDCNCIVIKPKNCKNCDNCKKVKYDELFKDNSLFEQLKDEPKFGDVVSCENGNKWIVMDIFDTNKSDDEDYQDFLHEYDGTGEQKSEYPAIDDVIDAGFDYVVACSNADDEREVIVCCYGDGGVTKVTESLSEDEFKDMYLKVIKDWEGTQYFNHLEEIADNDMKIKKLYNDAKRIEQMKHISIHDALYSLIRNGKV